MVSKATGQTLLIVFGALLVAPGVCFTVAGGINALSPNRSWNAFLVFLLAVVVTALGILTIRRGSRKPPAF